MVLTKVLSGLVAPILGHHQTGYLLFENASCGLAGGLSCSPSSLIFTIFGICRGRTECFLKSTCAFLCFFFTLVAFFPCNFLKSAFLCFFWAKMCFFSVEPPIFS